MTKSVQKPAKAIIFARVSSVEQKDNNSLDAQIFKMKEYCIKKNYEVIKEIKLVESSTRGEREHFYEMINFIKKQEEPIALIVDSVDRLQRSFKEVPILEELRVANKVSIHFLREKQVLDKKANSAQLMAYQMFVLMATAYANSISENAKRGVQLKLEKGECTCKAPLGYLNVRDKTGNANIIIDAQKAPLVKKIFEMYSLGSTSLGDLEKFAKDNNLTNTFFKGSIKTISKNVISCLLKNPFYYGEIYVQSHDKYYPHKYEKIIDRDLFNKCQDVRMQSANSSSNYKTSVYNDSKSY